MQSESHRRPPLTSRSCNFVIGKPTVFGKQVVTKSKNVNFAKFLQIREIKHRNDMTHEERDGHWTPRTQKFKDILAASRRNSHLTGQTLQRRRLQIKESFLVRRSFIIEATICRLEGKDNWAATKSYNYYSQQAAERARNVAVELEQEVHHAT